MTRNVSTLMSDLPVHSHHRATLVHYLSRDLDSETAARVLHTSSSYVRQCRRKSYDDSDLFLDKSALEYTAQREMCSHDASHVRISSSVLMPPCTFSPRYARDVKRAKLHEGRVAELIDYLVTACPTKSGSKHVTYHQYVTDDALYQGYRGITQQPVCFNTFMKLKSFLRVRHMKKYFGMFDCRACYRRTQLPTLIQQATTYSERIKLELELDTCNQHHELSLSNAVNTPFSGLSSSRVNYLY